MKTVKKRIIVTLLSVVVFLGLIAYGFFWLFLDINRLPLGDFVAKADSPNGEYTVKTYRSSSGATTDFAILGVLEFNQKDKKQKKIYWNYHEDSSTIVWIDNSTVRINNHTIEVPNGKYDFRLD